MGEGETIYCNTSFTDWNDSYYLQYLGLYFTDELFVTFLHFFMLSVIIFMHNKVENIKILVRIVDTDLIIASNLVAIIKR